MFLVPLVPPPVPPALSARAAVLMDGDTGEILSARNADLELPQASTTKLMTALVAAEAGNLDRLVTISTASSEVEGSSMILQAGEQRTIRELLQGLLLVSGNDAAHALAEAVAGSPEAFVARMNDKARDLGLRHTHYANPHGLPDPMHHSSARDLALIARAALANPVVAGIAATKVIDLPGNGLVRHRRLINHNKLLGKFPGAWGGKTGYTSVAGRCFVGSARRDGRYVIEAILDSPRLWVDAANLLNFGIRRFQTFQLAQVGTPMGSVSIENGELGEVPIALARPAALVAPRGTRTPRSYTELSEVQAPIRAGQTLGHLVAVRDGRELGRWPLVATRDVGEATSWLVRILQGLGVAVAGLFALVLPRVVVRGYRRWRRNEDRRRAFRERRARAAALTQVPLVQRPAPTRALTQPLAGPRTTFL